MLWNQVHGLLCDIRFHVRIYDIRFPKTMLSGSRNYVIGFLVSIISGSIFFLCYQVPSQFTLVSDSCWNGTHVLCAIVTRVPSEGYGNRIIASHYDIGFRVGLWVSENWVKEVASGRPPAPHKWSFLECRCDFAYPENAGRGWVIRGNQPVDLFNNNYRYVESNSDLDLHPNVIPKRHRENSSFL